MGCICDMLYKPQKKIQNEMNSSLIKQIVNPYVSNKLQINQQRVNKILFGDSKSRLLYQINQQIGEKAGFYYLNNYFQCKTEQQKRAFKTYQKILCQRNSKRQLFILLIIADTKQQTQYFDRLMEVQLKLDRIQFYQTKFNKIILRKIPIIQQRYTKFLTFIKLNSFTFNLRFLQLSQLSLQNIEFVSYIKAQYLSLLNLHRNNIRTIKTLGRTNFKSISQLKLRQNKIECQTDCLRMKAYGNIVYFDSENSEQLSDFNYQYKIQGFRTTIISQKIQ